MKSTRPLSVFVLILVTLFVVGSGCKVEDATPHHSAGGEAGAAEVAGSDSGGAGGAEAGAGGAEAGAGGAEAGAGGAEAGTGGVQAGAGGAQAGAGGEGGAAVSTLVGIQGAAFVEGDAPPTSTASNLPTIDSATSGSVVTNGGTTRIRIQVPSTSSASTFIVVVDGDNGYFAVTTTQANTDGSRAIQLQIDNDVTLTSMTVRIAPVDSQGNVGAYHTVTFTIVPTGVGDLKVTLSFDQDTDLDLHVTEPSNYEIYYSHRTSPSGGHLDLDSNAGCEIDGVNNEDIYWPTGMAPSGTYSVSVVNYSYCVSTPVHYTVTVSNGKSVDVFEGMFSRDAGGSATHLVTTFVH